MNIETNDHSQQDSIFRIEITLDEDFKTQFQKLKRKYGEEIFAIEGLSKEDLNITRFFDKFMNSNNVANASIDDNSNVTDKNISIMLSESRKPYNKLLSHNKIYIELKEKFGKETADKWLELQINGALYSHDSHESTLKPYSYFGDETILIKYKNKMMLVSFRDLFKIVEEPEVLLHKEDKAYCKYTNDLAVWDKNRWTKVIRAIRKPKTTDFMFIKGSNGVSQIVTTNHPVITTKGDVNAIDVTTEHSIITANPQIEFGTKIDLNLTEELLKAGFEREEIMLRGEKVTEETDVCQNVQVSLKHGTNPIPNILQLDRDFGWLYGMILAEGCVTEHNVSICQFYNDILDEIVRILEEKKLPYYFTQKGNNGCKVVNIRSTVLRHILVNTFEYSNGAKSKKLPSNFLDYNKEFLKGVVGGLLDGDGTLMLKTNRRITIRLTSRQMLNQISFLVQQMGYNVRDGKPAFKENNGCSFEQKNYIYQIAFTPFKDGEDFTSIKIKNNVESYSTKERSASYTNSRYSFGYGEVRVINADLLDKIDDEFVYDISTETGHFMCNNIASHNCFAFSLKPIVDKGLYFIKDMKAKPAKHLDTFNHHVLEFVSYATNMQSGAVGIPDYLIYAYYYWQKDVKTGYVSNAEVYKRQKWQEILFNLNQPYLKGGEQSAYTNFSILDREHIMAFFGAETYPDGSLVIDHLEEVIQYQKDFLDYERELREEKFFTFPVISASLLFQNGKYVDEDMARFICKHNMTWQDVNIYNAENVDALSSCCFDGKQLTLTRSSDGINYMPFEELYNGKYRDIKKNFTIFHNGSWVQGKTIKLPKRNLYKITTANKKEIYVTDNHIHPVLNSEKLTTELTTEDYLLFNNIALDTFPEKDKGLTYEEGLLIGMYLGDGSLSGESTATLTTKIHLSLNEEKYKCSINKINQAIQKITNNELLKFTLHSPYNNVFPLALANNDVINFIREYVSGNYSYEKELNLECLLQSKDFRMGILNGYYLTDGGNSNRIYTTSEKLIGQIEVLMTSLGLNSVVDVVDRTDEKVIIRGQEFNRNFPTYCIRWYDPKNKRSLTDIFKVKNNNIYFKITSIEKIESSSEYVYCFEMKNQDEQYFTLPNGIITHNCRLTSSLKDIKEDEELQGHFNSIGGTSISIGSAKVSTINLVRIALESKGDFEEYKRILKDRVDVSLKYLHVQREVLKKNIRKNLLPLYSYELMDMKKQFSTIGITGVFEAIKLLGGISENATGVYYNDKGIEMATEILNIINDMNKTTRELYGYTANTEQIPSESCAIKICKKDKLIFGQDCVDTYIYGNQWIPLNQRCDVMERVKASSMLDKACGGGVMLHINLAEKFSDEEQAWLLMNKLARDGIIYFSFIMKINVCSQDHSFYENKCPACGGEVTDSYIKIVGYLVKTSSYKKERATEMNERVFYDVGGTED